MDREIKTPADVLRSDHPDVRELRKWLNEERTSPVDRAALARVLAMIMYPPQPNLSGMNDLVSHYCNLLDNIGDLPIPNFEEWALRNYTKGHAILEANGYFRSMMDGE